MPQILAELRAAVGDADLILDRTQLQTYECDGLTNFRALPGAVVLPRDPAEVQGAVRVCAKHKIPSSPAAPGPASAAARCPHPAASSSASRA